MHKFKVLDKVYISSNPEFLNPETDLVGEEAVVTELNKDTGDGSWNLYTIRLSSGKETNSYYYAGDDNLELITGDPAQAERFREIRETRDILAI